MRCGSAAVAILFYVILHHTKFGQQLFLIGVNRHAAPTRASM